MGDIVQRDTHVKRSSGMSLAVRWKRENIKLIYSAAILFLACTALLLAMLYGTATKRITLVVDGQETAIETKQWVVQKLLQEQHIELGEHDRITKQSTSTLKDGDRVEIERAIPIVVTADGQTETRYTLVKTVASALAEANISFDADDKVSPDPQSDISANTSIQVVRVEKVVEEATEPVPYEIVKKSDPELPKGKEKVVQEGQEGVLAKQIEKVYEDGRLVNENVIDQAVRQESVQKVVAVGTKNPVVVLSASSPDIDQVSKDGVTFAYKKVLNNVTLTAYSAHADSTGKSEDHPQFGLTYSGTRVMEGRTVAVDPKVIPIGWWVYIEGIGLRRAEDIGSGVKGNKIDIYYNSEAYAKKFGMKSGYKVYVIGKEKPAMN